MSNEILRKNIRIFQHLISVWTDQDSINIAKRCIKGWKEELINRKKGGMLKS